MRLLEFDNPLQMNDWKTRKFVVVAASILIALWGSIASETIGFEMPVLRELVATIFLLFIPGFAAMRLLRVHNLGGARSTLYAVGLSVTIVMIVGVLVEVLGRFLGTSRPISVLPVALGLSLVTIALLVIGYLRVRDSEFDSPTICVNPRLVPPFLFLLLLPVLSIAGTTVLNQQGANLVLVCMILLVALITFMVGFDRFIPERLFAWAIFLIAISLLYQTALASDYISGWDIQHEYYIANRVLEANYWDPSFPTSTNAMLSVVILPPVFSLLSSMDLEWILRIVYPLLFAMLPLGLFKLIQPQTSNRIAFFSAFFLTSYFAYYLQMVQLARQEIAEFFLILVLLLLFENRMKNLTRGTLLFLFSFSLIASHYGTAFMFLGLATIPCALRLARKDGHTTPRKMRAVSGRLVVSSAAILLLWYTLTAGSKPFNDFADLGSRIAMDFFAGFLSKESSQGLVSLAIEPIGPTHLVTKYVFLLSQFLIVVGFIYVVSRRSRARVNAEFASFGGGALVFMIAGIVLPYIAGSYGTVRLYHMGLIFLAPYCIIGFSAMGDLIHSASRAAVRLPSTLSRGTSVFFVAFLMLNTGLVYELTGDHPTTYTLNHEIDGPFFNSQEVASAEWLHSFKGDFRINADTYRMLLMSSLDYYTVVEFKTNNTVPIPESYYYFGTLNIETHRVIVRNTIVGTSIYEYISYERLINQKCRIFDNGGSETYFG